MHSAIIRVAEEARGCGFRKVGGIYLRDGGGGLEKCGKLPIVIPPFCPTCGEGIRQSRAPRMHRNLAPFWTSKRCQHQGSPLCASCPFSLQDIGPALLLWIGEKFYPTPSAFAKEARERGISRRIGSLPKGFIPGQTWVVLAHPKAIRIADSEETLPGIIGTFKVDRVEVVVDETITDAEVEAYLKRGLQPVIVERIGGGFEGDEDGEE